MRAVSFRYMAFVQGLLCMPVSCWRFVGGANVDYETTAVYCCTGAVFVQRVLVNFSLELIQVIEEAHSHSYTQEFPSSFHFLGSSIMAGR